MINHLGKIVIIDSGLLVNIENISQDYWNMINGIYIQVKDINISIINDLIEKHNLQCYVDDDNKSTKLNTTGIITNDPENISKIKKEHPNLKIGIKTAKIVDCKNAELMEADFIWLGPFKTIGIETYETLTPLEMPYEWMILNVDIPIFSYGSLLIKDLKELNEKINLGGIVSNFNSIEESNKFDFKFKL